MPQTLSAADEIRLAMNRTSSTPRVTMSPLLRHGFTAIRSRVTLGSALMRGELPLNGHVKCA